MKFLKTQKSDGLEKKISDVATLINTTQTNKV